MTLPAPTLPAAPETVFPTPHRENTATPQSVASLAAFSNPVFDQDFPDPDVLKVGDIYYAYATNASSLNIQVARSTDLVNWRLIRDALPVLPAWAVKSFGYAWAPEVIAHPAGEGYLMYFTARFAIQQGGTQCIGVATSATPEGPFRSRAEQPLICQSGQGGSIDPSSFVDADGTRYLLWKNDGNSVGGQSWIYIQKIAADGVTLLEEPVRLITADQRWEGILVEGPTLWKQAGHYYLFYSANDYTSPRYAAGWAVADDPLGPYEKPGEPFLETDLGTGIVGPGGQDVVIGHDGETWVLFHGWRPGGYRAMHLAKLEWDGETPVAAVPTRELVP